jgi:hypothetical protein
MILLNRYLEVKDQLNGFFMSYQQQSKEGLCLLLFLPAHLPNYKVNVSKEV